MLKLTAFIFLAGCLTSCGQANSRSGVKQTVSVADKAISISPGATQPPRQKPANPYYPFELQNLGGQYQVVANIESKDLYPRYYNFFQNHGYEGNGYCWEGHITQILEKLDRKLLRHLDFNPEAGAFLVNADSKESQLQFVELLSPIFSDMKKLEEWVKKADRSRIDD